MTQTVTTIDVRMKLGDILNRVALRHDQFIVVRKGKPLAAMVPVEKLAMMEKAARLHLAGILSRRDTATLAPDADRLANEAKHQSRAKPRSIRKRR